jgi:hypothetical protein
MIWAILLMVIVTTFDSAALYPRSAAFVARTVQSPARVAVSVLPETVQAPVSSVGV